MALITKSTQFKINELRNSHNWCCLKILSDYSYVWDVVLYRAERGDINVDHKPTIKSGSYEDLNDAVNSVYIKANDYINKIP